MKIELVDARASADVDATLRWLQLQTLPSDEVLNPKLGHWWICRSGDVPAAFMGLCDVHSWPDSGYVARCGVLPPYRGMGLQRRMLTVLERKARALGLKRLISSTYLNPHSANNFIARGYITYEPTVRWGADNTIYWLKELA